VEFTGELSGAFSAPAESGGFPRAYVTRRSATSDRWFHALESLFGGTLPENGWVTTRAERPSMYSGNLESLDDPSTLNRWLQGIVERAANPIGFPHILAPQVPTTSKTFFRVGVVATLVSLLLCGTMAWTMTSQASSMRSEIDRLKKPAEDKKRLDKNIKELEGQIDELRLQSDEVLAKRDRLRLLMDRGNRFSVLLRSLAGTAESNVVVDSITPVRNGVALKGRTIRNEAVSQLVQRLEPEIAGMGWAVRPPTVTGANQTKSGGPWTFEIQLVDQQPTVATPESDRDDPTATQAAQSHSVAGYQGAN
ncbi:MAG: hypothetical protein AAFP69_15280, partial [Planctomycetota bacterium]